MDYVVTGSFPLDGRSGVVHIPSHKIDGETIKTYCGYFTNIHMNMKDKDLKDAGYTVCARCKKIYNAKQKEHQTINVNERKKGMRIKKVSMDKNVIPIDAINLDTFTVLAYLDAKRINYRLVHTIGDKSSWMHLTTGFIEANVYNTVEEAIKNLLINQPGIEIIVIKNSDYIEYLSGIILKEWN